MKKLFAITLCAALSIPAAASALAAGTSPGGIAPAPAAVRECGYDLYVDGRDTGENACIMVPLRTFAEQMGFSVTWNGDGTVGMDNGTMRSTITIGKDLYQVVTSVEGLVGMSAPFSLGAAPFVVDGTTYVPLELFESLLGNREDTVTLENGVLALSTSDAEEGHVRIPSPFTDCESLAAAEKMAGFPMECPGEAAGSDHRVCRAAENELLEVIYQRGENETARIRKAPGSGDISGDYKDYAEVKVISAAGVPVTMKGGSGRVSLAIWNSGDYTYSVTVASPVSDADMIRLVSEIR